MIQATLYKRRRRALSGKLREARHWSIKWRMPGEKLWRTVGLGVSLREVAERKLVEFRSEKELELSGVRPAQSLRDAARRPMVDHLCDFVAERLDGRDRHYAIQVERRLQRLISECRWTLLKDVTAESFIAWRLDHKLHAKTLNDYLVDASGLLRWMCRRGRLIVNPLATVDALPCGASDPKRRPLSDDEVCALLRVAGANRLAYLLALTTGLRRAELKGLQWGDVRLDAPQPFLSARASTTKNGKTATCWLRDDVVAELRAVRPKDVAPDAPVLAHGPPVMEVYLSDLSAAGVAEYDQRGRRADFHALRHTLATNLNRKGVPPRIAQEIMRHSDMALTMKTYTDAGALPTMDGVNALPRWDWQSAPERAKATGTAGKQVVLQSGSRKAVQRRPSVSINVQGAGFVEVRNRPVKPSDYPALSTIVDDGSSLHLAGLEPATFGSVGRWVIHAQLRPRCWCNKHLRRRTGNP